MKNLNHNLICHASIFFDDELSTLQQRVLVIISNTTIDGICRIPQNTLSKTINIKYSTFRNILCVLRKKGYVRKIDKGISVFVNGKQLNLGNNIYEI